MRNVKDTYPILDKMQVIWGRSIMHVS